MLGGERDTKGNYPDHIVIAKKTGLMATLILGLLLLSALHVTKNRHRAIVSSLQRMHEEELDDIDADALRERRSMQTECKKRHTHQMTEIQTLEDSLKSERARLQADLEAASKRAADASNTATSNASSLSSKNTEISALKSQLATAKSAQASAESSSSSSKQALQQELSTLKAQMASMTKSKNEEIALLEKRVQSHKSFVSGIAGDALTGTSGVFGDMRPGKNVVLVKSRTPDGVILSIPDRSSFESKYAQELLQDGVYEPGLIQVLRTILEGKCTGKASGKTPQVADIGAGMGQRTAIAAALGCGVMSFEYEPVALPHLKRVVALNEFGSRVQIVEKGVKGGLLPENEPDANFVNLDDHLQSDLVLLSIRLQMFAETTKSAAKLLKDKKVTNIIVSVYCPEDAEDVDKMTTELQALYGLGAYVGREISREDANMLPADWNEPPSLLILTKDEVPGHFDKIAAACKRKPTEEVFSTLWLSSDPRFADHSDDEA